MPHRITCSWCETPLRVAEAITAPFVTCPNCLARIPNPGTPETRATPATTAPAHRPRAATLDEDTHGDSKLVGCGLIVLALLGGLGILQIAALALHEPDGYIVWIALAIGVGFLALVATGIMFVRTRKNPRERTVGRVVLGTFALIGALMLGGFALLVLFFIVCLVTVLGGGFKF